MTRSRRTFTAQEKAAIVLRHLVDKTPVSDLCDEFGLQPTQVYAWQKQLAANAALAFQSPRQSLKHDDAKDRKIVALAGRWGKQVLRLEKTLWQSQRTQRCHTA